MLTSSALIGLREGLEAALVVSILIAFLVKSDQRAAIKWVWGGVAAALLICVGIGTVVAYTIGEMQFEHQEIVGGSLSIAAVGFVTWMIFWMRSTARTLAKELRGKLSDALAIGPVAVAVMALLAVGREGLETMAFFYANVRTAEAGTREPLIGFIVGIVAAVVLGWLIYRGAVTFNLGKFFTYTGVLLVFVAAGILGYGLHDLQEAGVLPGLNTLAFDLSGPMPEDSWYGALLKGLLNYSAQTTVLQAVVWVLYVVVVLTLFLWPRKQTTPAASPSTPVPVKEHS
ncbi:iron uptake transporter permease EfeU [Actinophytocola oryzae]|uniref:High-affinity iron transporter n=1 Tax=Actinophytocola oryzae TaxID=502181 RepID=A0A4R7V966_9PSEU|nr:iron uptake transporter permease EfeU [Actinophytocola oryzae]TDV45454.1 high-affinity iron transporter [Actinophytocola oryzae]